MHRYVAAAQNAYYKAITQLTKLQKERQAAKTRNWSPQLASFRIPIHSTRIRPKPYRSRDYRSL